MKKLLTRLGLRPLVKPSWETERGKGGFLRSLPPGSVVLDVGCGNGSPHWFKSTRPDIYYIGLDVGDYRQVGDPSQVADEYIVVPPSDFAAAIEGMRERCNAVVSSHNIEHCQEPGRVLRAMMNALKPGGMLYLSTPCSASVGFPRREGTLNFYDDPTHVAPVSYSLIISECQAADGKIVYGRERYRPFMLALKGFLMEPYFRFKGKVAFDGATWACYGFESVLWICKNPSGSGSTRP